MSDIDEGQTLELAGSSRGPMIWMLGLFGIPIVGVAIALIVVPTVVAPAAKVNLPTLLYLAPAVMLLTGILLARSFARAGVRIGQGELVVKTGTGSKRIALSSLRAHGVRVIDLYEHAELKPFLRTWGTSLPGFSGGWFRLRNGEKALCLLLDRHRVSYLRSDDDNVSLLLSLAEPDKLRALLERGTSA